MKKELGYCVALAGALTAAGALATALIRKKKREEVYHEAELKAMNELDEMIGKSDDALDCDTCSCNSSCAVAEEQAAPADDLTDPEEDQNQPE